MRGRRAMVGMACAALLLTSAASRAQGESEARPAVSQINGSVTGFYQGRYFLDWDSDSRVDTRWNDAGGVAAAVFVPLGSRFGASVSGGGMWGEDDDWIDFPLNTTTSISQSAWFVGADLFWRDPATGFVGFFYDYYRDRTKYAGQFNAPPPFVAVFHYELALSAESQDVELAGGYYLDEIDLGFGVGYARSCTGFRVFGELDELCLNGYDVEARLGAYPGASDPLRIGVALGGGQVYAGPFPGTLTGRLDVDWQPHCFGNRSVRLGGSILGGAFLTEGESRPFVTSRLSISVDLPGSDGLKQLFREMQI